MVTLGLYAAWAKTEQRKYLWQNIEFHGQRLSYLGTGKELFIGYLKVFAAAVVWFGVPAVVSYFSSTLGAVLQFALAIALFFVIPLAIYGSQRYLLSRTTWRGIHFGLEAEGARPYVSQFLLGALLCVVTLGFYIPIYQNRLHRIVMDHTSFGNARFRYTGDDSEAFRIGVIGFLLSIVTLGIYGFWYQAELGRFRARNTHIAGATVHYGLTGGDLFVLTLAYAFGTAFTLGLAFPWLATWGARFALERIWFEGTIDFGAIEQGAGAGSATADGLADALDVGLAV
jgi:uncharacterized membrane protein YjgN (DUF898 family)